MLELVQIFQKNPNTLKINLEMRNLKDMTQMVAVLHKFKHLNQLSLHGNKLKSVPPLDCLQKLQFLDISNNPIIIDNILLDRLFQIPQLEDLNINATPEELTTLVEHLPKLKTINGNLINRHIIKKQKLEDEKKGLHKKLTEQLTKMKEIHTRLSKIYMEGDSRDELFKKDDEFNFIYRDIQQEMVYFYSGLEDQLALEGVFSHCKNKLTVILDNLMIRILDEFGNDNVVKAYQEISKIKAQNFDVLLKIIFNMSFQRHITDEMNSEDNKFRKQTLYLNQIYRLKKEIIQLKKEQTNIERLTAREQEIKKGYQNKYSLKTPTSSAKTPINTRGQFFFPLNKSSSKSYLQPYTKEDFFQKKTSPEKVISKSPSKVLNKSPSKVMSKTPSKVKLSKDQDLKQDIRSKGPRSQSNKIFSLEQMLSLIDQIMSQKRKYNNKNQEKKEPYETTEQFLFSFFSRKYGLKEMALQWSLSTIKSIEKYCRQSIEVQIFGKILKNKLYQQYYDECRQFKSVVMNFFKKQKFGESINEAEFRRVFLFFFSYQNKETVDKIIQKTQFPSKTQDVAYFIRAYKLAFEEKHMKKFIEVFERLDYQVNGFLDQQKCKTLYSQLLSNISEEVMTKEEKQKLSQTFNQSLAKSMKDRFIFSEVFQMAHNIL